MKVKYNTKLSVIICNYQTIRDRLTIKLSVIPTKTNFDLTPQKFRDALAICYHKPLLNATAFCDGCGAPSTLDHFYTCMKGGLIMQQHNEIRDAVGDLAAIR